MKDPDAIEKLAGIDRKLADLSELGKQMANANDPAAMHDLQMRFQALARAFAQHVQAVGAAIQESRKAAATPGSAPSGGAPTEAGPDEGGRGKPKGD